MSIDPKELKKVYKKYSYLGVDPKQFSQAAQVSRQEIAPAPESVKATPTLNPQQEQRAQNLLIKRFEHSWGRIDPTFAAVTPMGSVVQAGSMTSDGKYIALQNAYNQTINTFAAASGNEYLGAYINAMGLNDDQQRQSTLAALTRIITGGTTASAPTMTELQSRPRIAGAPGVSITPEQFVETIADPAQFKSMSYEQQQQFIQRAQEVVDAYGKRGHQFDAITRAVAAISTGDLTNALSPQEAAELQRAVKDPHFTEGGSGTLALGPHAELGSEGDILTFDPEWARQHPAKAAAEVFYLQQQFPTATVEYGRGGIGGELINAIGKPIDLIAAVPSALINLAGGKIRDVFDHGDVEEMKATRDELAASLKTAPLADHDDILHAIDKLDDRIGVHEGSPLGFSDLVDRSLNSDQANLGFAENIVQGGGLLPGDRGYEASIGVTMVAGSILFDPITWAAGIASGARAAATIPKVAGEGAGGARAVRGVIARFVYERMALTPEEFMESAHGLGAIDNLAEVARTASPENYAYLLQQHGLSASQRLLLESAGSDPEAIRDAMVSIIGGYEEGINVPFLSQKISNLGSRLNERDLLLQEARAAQRVEDGTHDAYVTSLERHIDEMDANGLSGTPEWSAATDELERLQQAGPRDVARSIVPGSKPVPEGSVRLFTEQRATKVTDAGVKASPNSELGRSVVWSQERVDGINARAAAEGTIPEGTVIVEHWAPESEVKRVGTMGSDQVVHGDIPSDRIINVYRAGEAPPPAIAPEVLSRLDELNASVTADRAEMAMLKSVRSGAVYSTGRPFNFGDLQGLSKSSSAWSRSVAELDAGLREFPKGFIPEEVSARFGGSAQRLWHALAVSFRPSGLEGAEAAADGMRRAIWLPGITAPEGALIDLTERSRESLTNVGRLLGVPETSIAEQMGQWDNLVLANNAQESYKWLTKTWERFVLESPRVEPAMRANLMKLWDSPFEQWGSDVIRTSAPGEYAVHEPVMYKTMLDPVTGDPLKAGQPIFSSDFLSGGVFLPDMNHVIEAISPKLSKVLQGRGVTGATSIWKRVILTSKLPFALPSRIVGELLFARMSAFDLASLGNWGVLDWARSVRGTGEFARFIDDPAFALGGMLQDFEGAGKASNRATTLGVINSTAGDDYYRALSGRLGHVNATSAPELRYIIDAPSPESLIVSLRSVDAPEALKLAAQHWGTGEGGLDVVAARVWDYVHNVVPGTGRFSEELRTALRTGKLADGTELGTIEFANRLRDEAVAGRWLPGMTDVHGKYAVGLNFAVEKNVATRLNDLMFRWFYTKPEAALGRVPAFRQRATTLFSRLRAMGYPEDLATEVSKAAAARSTADDFFRIGAHTYGEAMMRNISPFFPAWRELTDTWLLKAPQRIGGGSRILGGLYMANRTRLTFDVMKHLGVVTEAPDGSLRVNLPFLDPIFNAILPGDGRHVTASFDSLFGVLPFPKLDAESWTDAVGSLLPSLGGAAIPVQLLALNGLDRAHPGWQKDVADLIAPFGVGNIGGNWSNLYTAFALQTGMDPVAPWEKFSNGDFKEAMVNNSIDDALRFLTASGDPRYAPPNAADFDLADKQGAKDYAAAYVKWQDTLITDAEHLAGSSMMTRSVLSMVLPFSAKPTTKEQDSITAIWGLLNGEGVSEDLRDSLTGPLLESFKAAYPEADWYTIGKSDALGARGHTEQSDDLEALFSEGLLNIRTPQEYTVWAQGMASYSAYLARRSAIYARFENNPVEYLLDGDEARQQIAKVSGSWQQFLISQDNLAKKEGIPSFRELMDRSQTTKIMAADDVALQGLTRILPLIQDKLEAGDPEGFAKFRANVYDSISAAAQNASSPQEKSMFDSIGKYYDKVADPYYKHLNKLYDAVNKLPDGSPQQQVIYDEIRHYSNTAKPARINGVKFPTPEQVSFFTKTPDEQAAWAAKKLSYGHPEWLTSFQQDVLKLGGNKKVTEFTDWVSLQEQEFKKRYPVYTMSGYQDARERLDRVEGQEAQSRGLGDTWQRWQAPLYRKLDTAGLGSGPGWSAAVNYADQATRSLKARGYVADSTSPNATADQRWLFSKLDTLYKTDQTFANTVDTVATGLGGDEGTVSRQQVFWTVFLDGYGTPPPNLY